MPPSIPSEDYRAVLSAVAKHPDGVAIGRLLGDPGLAFPKRTLQRRLDDLVSSGRLERVGKGRGAHYRMVADVASPVVREDPAEYGGKNWLSQEARQIRTRISQPVTERIPVGYRPEFLASYEPNRTQYLPDSLRGELASLGQVGMSALPAGTYLRQVMDRLLIDLSWNSSRLEGNTYSLLETERLLAQGEAAGGKNAFETQMILNHKAAIEMLADQAGEVGFNRYTICNIHALLSDNLLPDPTACGRLRSRPVGISGTVFHPLEGPQRIEERFDEILGKADAIRDPFEQAFFVMVHLPYLQPFEDVNKRVSRLAANIPLVRRNLCPLSFVDVQADDYVGGIIGVYELNRIEYLRDVFVWAYRRSCLRYAAIRQSLGEPDPFRLHHRDAIRRAVAGIVEGGLDRAAARRHAEAIAKEAVTSEERERFESTVVTELESLHLGNIARFRLRPSVFETWQAGWET